MRKLSKNNVLFSNREKFRQIVWRLLTWPFLLRFWFNFFCSFGIFDVKCFLMKLSWFHCIKGRYLDKMNFETCFKINIKVWKKSWNRCFLNVIRNTMVHYKNADFSWNQLFYFYIESLCKLISRIFFNWE